MKNKSLLFVTGLLISGSLFAQSLPYLPIKVDVEKEIQESDFIKLDLDSDFTLEFDAKLGTSIKLVNSSLKGIEYLCAEDGKYRIANKSGVLYIYQNGVFKEQTSIYSLEYPLIFDEADDKSAKSGIYSEYNILKNPGFEDIIENGVESNSQYIPSEWQSANFTADSRSRVNTNYENNLKGLEGRGTLMHHGYTSGEGMYFYQELNSDNFKANKKYLVKFRTWSHSNAFGGYTAKIGISENDNMFSQFKWTQASSAYDCKDIEFEFTIPETYGGENIYFTIIRDGVTIGHFDRMTIVERLENAPMSSGLTAENILNVKFDETGAYAPYVKLEDGQYYDFTSSINDANVSNASSWSGSNIVIKSGDSFVGAPDIYYLDLWQSGIFTYDVYQNLKDLPKGKYRLTAAARSNSDNFYIYALTDTETKSPIINNNNTEGELGKGWNKIIIEDIIVKDGIMKIGIGGTSETNGRWLSVDNFNLYYYGADASLLKEKLLELISEAKIFDINSVPSGIAMELLQAIEFAENVTDDEEEISRAEALLLDKLSNANSYIVYYSDLRITIKSIESLKNSWFDSGLEKAYEVLNSESPTLDQIKIAQQDLLDCVVDIMDGFSGYNYTDKISNPGIDSEKGWIFNNVNGNHNTSKGGHYTYDEMNRYLDSWNGTAGALVYEAYQIVEGLEPGLYILSAAARASGTGAFIVANDMKREIPNNGASDGELGEGWNIVRIPIVLTSETLKLGCKTMSGLWTGTWLSVDDFTLNKYPYNDDFLSVESNEEDNVNIYTKGNNIIVEGDDDYKIFNANGIEVGKRLNYSSGFYIVKTKFTNRIVVIE